METPTDSPANPRRVARFEQIVLPDGRVLCARCWTGVGEPVVFLHGLLDSSEGWSELCAHLTGPAIAFDLPGFGYSDPPAHGSLGGYAEDIAAGLAALGVKRCALVGHSLGGAVAAALAEVAPDRVSRLVLLAPVGFGHVRLAEVAALPGIRTAVRAAMPFAFGSRFAITAAYVTMVSDGATPDPASVERIVAAGPRLVAGVHEGIRAIAAAGRAFSGSGRRLRYRGPVRAIWGDRDRLVSPAHADALRRALPQTRLEVWPGMGHHPMKERFAELFALVADASIEPGRLAGSAVPRLAGAV
jgi:pimeloyl-ACP methyl ester carboxylesterase